MVQAGKEGDNLCDEEEPHKDNGIDLTIVLGVGEPTLEDAG